MARFPIIVLCVVLLFSYATAGLQEVSISPESIEITLFGGETIQKNLFITNNLGETAFVNIDFNVQNQSKDYNGFEISLSENQFELLAGQSKEILLSIETAQNILPEKYSVFFTAETTAEEQATENNSENTGTGNNNYGGGGNFVPYSGSSDNNSGQETFAETKPEDQNTQAGQNRQEEPEQPGKLFFAGKNPETPATGLVLLAKYPPLFALIFLGIILIFLGISIARFKKKGVKKHG